MKTSRLRWAAAVLPVLFAASAFADIGPIAVPPFNTGFFPPYQYVAATQPAGQTIHGARMVADWTAGTTDAWSSFFRMFPTAPGNMVGSTLDYGGRPNNNPYHFDATRYLIFPGGVASGGDWKLSFSMTFPGTVAQLNNVSVTLLDNPVSTYGANSLDGPTWIRPREGATSVDPDVLVPYNVQPFQVDQTGRYDLFSTQSFDGMLFLYAGNFDPTKPLEHIVADNDDGRTGLGSSDIWLNHGGLPLALDSGQTYFLVTTGFRPEDAGEFTNYIGGIGHVTFVPEPGTLLLVAGALVVGARGRRQCGRR